MPDSSGIRQMAPLLDIRDLSVSFGGTYVLRDINLTVRSGESIGIIGESGSGKSMTWLAVMGLLPASAKVLGSAALLGEDILRAPQARLDGLRGGKIAMIFQDAAAALNPVRSIGWQIVEVLRLHRGFDGQTAQAEAKRLLDQVGMPEAGRRLRAYPFELSGGQNQRAMIAMALAGRPEVLIADEPTTALDVTIQAQILDLLRTLQNDTGMSLVMVSHDLGVIADVSKRAYVMQAGRIVEEGSISDLFWSPKHFYTQNLLAAAPVFNEFHCRRNSIPAPLEDVA